MSDTDGVATVEGATIKIDMIGLIRDHVPNELLPELALELSLQDAVIEHVANQILDGFTTGGASGATLHSIDSCGDPMSPLQEARRRVALQASEIAVGEIERLSRLLVEAEKNITDLRHKLFDRRPY